MAPRGIFRGTRNQEKRRKKPKPTPSKCCFSSCYLGIVALCPPRAGDAPGAGAGWDVAPGG